MKYDDDICDVSFDKNCDNCGKCLELDGVDIKAINIAELALNKESNINLEFDNEEESKIDEDKSENIEDILKNDFNINDFEKNDQKEESYEDAFDQEIIYFDDIGLEDDLNIEEFTEELYPGVRKYK